METQPNQPQDAQVPQTGPEIRQCRMPSSATTSKLDQGPNSTNSTLSRYEKTFFNYDRCRVNHKFKSLTTRTTKPHETPMETQPLNAHPPIDHFTNFTEISYEKTRNSYDFSEVPRRIPTAPAPCQSGHMPDRWK